MTTHPVPSFDELLTSAERSAVHLEMRDLYDVEDERVPYARWRAGDWSVEQDREHRQEWLDLVRRTVARGVTMRRARIVSEPVTTYIRFEHSGTPLNIEAGEQVRWLPRRKTLGIPLPGNDLWLVDDRIVRFNHFNGNGDVVEPEVSEEWGVIELCRSAFEMVWERAIPHDEYKIV